MLSILLYVEDIKNAIIILMRNTWKKQMPHCFDKKKKKEECRYILLEEYSPAHGNCYWQKIISLKLQDVPYKKNL